MPRDCVSEDESEQLLALVRQNELIFYPRHPSYKDPNIVGNVWESIAKAMKRDNGNYYCQLIWFLDNCILVWAYWMKKYQNLRDTYIKKKRLLKSSSGQATQSNCKAGNFSTIFPFWKRLNVNQGKRIPVQLSLYYNTDIILFFSEQGSNMVEQLANDATLGTRYI